MGVRGEGDSKVGGSRGRFEQEFGRVGSASCFFRLIGRKNILCVVSLRFATLLSHDESNRVNDVPNGPDTANHRAYTHIS